MSVKAEDNLNKRSVSNLDIEPLTFSGQFIIEFLQGAVLSGFDPVDLLEKAGLPSGVAEGADVRIDGRQFLRLFYTVQGEMNDIFLGFMPQPGKLALEHEQSRVRFQCASFGEALRATTQFREAVRNDVSYQYIEDAETHNFSLIVDYQTLPTLDRELFHWHRMFMIYRYYCWLIGRRFPLSSASFKGVAPSDPEVQARYSIFGCDLKFGASAYALTFDKKYLVCPIVRKSEAENVDYFINHPDWLKVPCSGTTWARHTEQILTQLQRDGVWSPTASMVGAMLGVSSRGLRVNLTRENTSFTDIKTRLRSELSLAYLLATDLAVTVIAESMGYSEPGDFSRAFSHWYGVSPSDYRKQYAGDKELIARCGMRLHEHNHKPN